MKTTDYHHQIVDSLTSGVIAVDKDGVVVTANPAACAHLNLAEDALAPGKKLQDNKLTKPLEDVFREVAANKQAVSRREIVVRLDDGTTKEIGLGASLIEGPEDFNGVIFLFTDMTERRSFEREAELNRQLASLGELTAGVVHELRSPVSVISGMSELLLRKLDPTDDRRKTVDTIIREASGLERLISQFLGFARPFELELTHCFPEDIAHRSLQQSQPRALDKSVDLEYKCEPDLPELRADVDHAARALTNLLNNAVDAVPAGGHVSLAVRRQDAEILFGVTDNGPGIHLEPGEDIFTPFFTKKEDGTGLGLPIVHRIVSAHHGAVKFKNLKGGGTYFEIRLPIDPGARR